VRAGGVRRSCEPLRAGALAERPPWEGQGPARAVAVARRAGGRRVAGLLEAPGPAGPGHLVSQRLSKDRITSGTTEGACQPVCSADSDCGERECDAAVGLCVDALAIGDRLSIGSPCDPSTPPGHCDGACEELATGFAVCTGLCVLPGSLARRLRLLPPGVRLQRPLHPSGSRLRRPRGARGGSHRLSRHVSPTRDGERRRGHLLRERSRSNGSRRARGRAGGDEGLLVRVGRRKTHQRSSAFRVSNAKWRPPPFPNSPFFLSLFVSLSGRADSNCRPHGPEPCALPNCATPRKSRRYFRLARENGRRPGLCQARSWGGAKGAARAGPDFCVWPSFVWRACRTRA
jgi:hypothetical protein